LPFLFAGLIFTIMISQDLLQILRCPMDPSRKTALTLDGDRLVCPSCGLRYPIKDGFAVMVVEEAELPAGCDSLEQLAGRHAPKDASNA
jgi:uncharacterized protein YbaR (Trm112 family)